MHSSNKVPGDAGTTPGRPLPKLIPKAKQQRHLNLWAMAGWRAVLSTHELLTETFEITE